MARQGGGPVNENGTGEGPHGEGRQLPDLHRLTDLRKATFLEPGPHLPPTTRRGLRFQARAGRTCDL